MSKSFIHALALAFLLTGFTPAHASGGFFGCTVASSHCADNACHTYKASDGSAVCVCPSGVNAPAGCLVDPQTSCWDTQFTYSCYSSTTTNTCTPTQVSGCNIINTSCNQTAVNGSCVSNQVTYACPNRATVTTNPPGVYPGSNCAEQPGLGSCVSSVFGYCTDKKQVFYCSDPTEPCVSDPNCTLSSTTCLNNVNGICSNQQQFYKCSKTTSTCVQTSMGSSCEQVNTEGLENQTGQKADPSAMNKALATMAMLDEIKKSLSADLPPKVFGGKALECTNQMACGSLFAPCGCDIGITEKKAGLTGSITSDEILLAGARRSNLAHYIGGCCVHKIPIINVCNISGDFYCAFPSVLAKLVQEQGRPQLAAMAAGGYAGASTVTVPPFPFYSGSGGWSAPINANGNTVYYWQWPAACNTTTPPATPPANGCPDGNFQSWFAVCDGGGCAAPTLAPPSEVPNGMVQSVVPYNTQGTPATLSRYVVADGGCDQSTNTCNYKLSAWNGSGGGTAMLRSAVSWSYYSTKAGYNSVNMLGNNYQFAGYSESFTSSGSTPSSVKMEYSTDSGKTFGTVNLPLSLPASADYVIPGTQISVYGSCPAPGYQCNYFVTVPATAIAKPWVVSGGCPGWTLDCSGFTLGQFMLLDLSKMDLSAWTATISANVKLPASAPMQSSATASAGTLATNASTSVQANPAGNATSVPQTDADNTVVAHLSESTCELSAGCNIKLYATSNWEQTYSASTTWLNNNPVSSISVSWGDGTSGSTSTTTVTSSANIGQGQLNGDSSGASVNNLPLFVMAHNYTAVGTYPIVVTFHMPDGSTHRSGMQVQVWQDTVPPSNQNNNAIGGADMVPGS